MVRHLVFVSSAESAPPPRVGVDIVVVDPAWTPGRDARADLVPIRPAVTAVLGRDDLLGESLERIDDWASSARMVELLMADGISYWYRLRETMWNWLHERLLWRRLIAELASEAPFTLEILADDEALAEVGAALQAGGIATVVIARSMSVPGSRPVNLGPEPRQPPTREQSSRASSWLRRIGSGLRPGVAARRPSEDDARSRRLDERVALWAAAPGPRVLAVSLGVRHAVAGPDGERLVDPHLDAVMTGIRAAGMRAGVVLLGRDHLSDDDWSALEKDEDVFPASLLRTRWHPRPGEPAPRVDIGLPDAGRAPLIVDGIDLAGGAIDLVRGFVGRGMTTNVRLTPRLSAMLRDLRPHAVVLTHESHREPWILAARRAAIPSFAIQHGILYPTHPGYAHPRDPARMMPDCTFVYGDYEREILLRHGAYRPEEVEAVGSPRLDLDRALSASGRDDEREAVRRELGVADGDRLLVVSTTNGAVARRFDFADILDRILGGPLPGVHVVFKLHPGEQDEGSYRATILGLAAARGYEAPPMTVIREVDLYRLLRAADAHLGFNSTVLTEAVVTGTPNLIAAGQRYGDLLGYVASGVAVPVRTVEDVAAALDDPRPPDPAARSAFLRLHFREGDASARIVARIRSTVGATG